MLLHSFDGYESHSIPVSFPSPFELQPHPLAQLAALDLQQHLQTINPSEHDFFAADGGKMFGVLVVELTDETPDKKEPSNQSLAYLAAFSGMLAGRWQRHGFAPPVFDLPERQQILDDGEVRLKKIGEEIEALLRSQERVNLQRELDILRDRQQCALEEAKSYYRRRRQQRHEIRLKIEFELAKKNVTEPGACAQTTAAELVDNQSTRSQSRLQLIHGQSASNQLTETELALQSQRDKGEFRALKHEWEQKLTRVQCLLNESDKSINSLRKTRKALSRQLQQRLFTGYRLASFASSSIDGSGNSKSDKKKTVLEFFNEALPPGGTGDCASIKLLNSCYQQMLKPVCMAEFWWGASPRGGVRHHNSFYPACRGKCRPILPHMLTGLKVQSPRYETVTNFPSSEPEILFEDSDLLVLAKPAGMLSVAGKTVSDSVESRLQSRYRGLVADGLSRMLVHRLDQATSGLMVAAKNTSCYKALHQQFERRQIDKSYVAVVDGLVQNDTGVVELPLRVDLDDRPRQMVCHQHGKSATTRYSVLARTNTQTRLRLFPVTGRTHQLRVHLAHPDGLNTPIAGDELYGTVADRLHLHAERLSFVHPLTSMRIDIKSPAPF